VDSGFTEILCWTVTNTLLMHQKKKQLEPHRRVDSYPHTLSQAAFAPLETGGLELPSFLRGFVLKKKFTPYLHAVLGGQP